MTASLREFLALRPSEEEREFVMEEFRKLWEAARSGQLTFGSTPADDVDLMDAAPDVLELRIGDRWLVGDVDELHLRMFFSEPAEQPGSLVAIEFFWKHPGPAELGEQTMAARAASFVLAQYAAAGYPNPDGT